MTIKNIVFDVGNVLVRWDPVGITASVFPELKNPASLATQLFKSQIWFNLNLGKITEQKLIQQYERILNIDIDKLILLMDRVKQSLVPIEGSFEILEKLYQANFSLYALTDNTKEIIAYLKTQYDFWLKFAGIVVSADVGMMKPSKEIFEYLLSKYQLNAHETVFIDDYAPNIEGAKVVDIHTIQFESAIQCVEDFRNFQIKF